MTSSRYRLLLGALSIIVLVLDTSLLSFASSKIAANPAFYNRLYSTLISGFNITILFGWIAYAGAGGILLTTISFIISSVFILKANAGALTIWTLPFFVSAFLGWSCLRAAERVEQLYRLKSEKLSEDANILSDTIPKSRSHLKALEDKLTRYSALKEVAEDLSSDLSLDDINELVIKKVVDTLGKPGRALLFLVDIKKEELELASSRDVSKVKAKKGDVFDHWVLRHRKSLIIEDIEKDFRFAADDVEEAKKKFKSLIETPLISEDKVIGIIRMDSMKDSIYTHDDLRLLDIIADLGAVAIENAILYSKTQELAIKDGLTGLAVRRYFMERFQEELKRASRKKGELALLIIDIDHFKEYNDKFGHTAGDLVLKHMARVLSSMGREGDIVARYGGEEMALLLLGVDREKAAAEAEAIRQKIEKEPLMLRRHRANLTVSIGVATYPRDATFEAELIKIADERLYKAKALGRNRTCAG